MSNEDPKQRLQNQAERDDMFRKRLTQAAKQSLVSAIEALIQELLGFFTVELVNWVLRVFGR